MSDIRQDISTMKTEIERKTGTILSKSQGIFDTVKTTSDLVSKINEGQILQTSQTKQIVKNQGQQRNSQTRPDKNQNQLHNETSKVAECSQEPSPADTDTAAKSFGVKNSQMFIQTKTAPRLEIKARWGPLPISMVLRSERSLRSKLKMLSLARTSKYMNNTSVLSIKKSEEDS